MSNYARSMSNDSELLRELSRHNLLPTLVRRRIIAETVVNEQLCEDEIEQTRSQFLKSNGLDSEDLIDQFIKRKGWDKEDFEWNISLPLRIKTHCKNHFQHKAEAHFLSRKNQLDRIVYSLLRTKDAFLAQELYLRVEGGEANFGDLATNYSEGPERDTRGIIGPVPITQAHPEVAEALRVLKPGELKRPFRVGEWWLVLRVESYTPAIFDEAMGEKLSQELFNQWVNEEAARRMAQQTELDVALDAE